MTEARSITVEDEDRGVRLDLFLSRKEAGTSRSQVQKWIAEGMVKVDGKARKAGFALEPGSTVDYTPLAPPPADLVPEDIPIRVLHEDDDLLVVEKPAGLVVHPGAGNWTGTLANALRFRLEELSREGSLRPGIVHRLDKGTSGLLVVAKNEKVHENLSRQFSLRTVKKVYFALVYGKISSQQGVIDLPIGRDPRSRIRISPRAKHPRTAVTRYEVVHHYRKFSFLRVFPLTGRTHQIRVHLLQLGHPVVGDSTYAAPGLLKETSGLGRLFLHASRLEFDHPTRGDRVCFESDLPDELARFLETLRE